MATMVYREKILPNKSKILWSLLAFFLIGVLSGLTVFALKKSKAASTTCYWVGDTSPANWNDATHWSDTSGGAGSTCDGGTVPGSDDDVVFDGGSTNGVTIDVDINIASLTLTADYTGIFDNATNNKNINVAGNVTMDNTQTNMGDGTWTVSGDFDNKDVTTFNRDDSTINLYGESKQIVSASTKYFNHVTVFGSYEVVGTSTMGGVLSLEGDAVLTANGSSSISLGQFGGRNDIQIKSPTAKITGTGSITMNGNSKISRKDGVIDIHTIDVFFVHSASNTLVPATYESENVIIRQRVDGDFAFAFQGGLYTFNGNVKFSLDAYDRVYTIDNSASPSFVFKGDVIIENPAGGTFVWQKGNGTITIGGTSAQNLDFLNKAVEDIVISNTTAPVSLVTNGVTTDQLTVNSNATFDLNGNNLSYPSSVGTYNNGTIRLKGNETLTNIANLDTDSGTVTYYGDNGGGGSPFTIYDFGTTDYYNLTFDATSGTDVFRPIDTLTIANNLTITQGTFDNATNNKDINVTGNVTMDNTQTNMGNATWTVSGDFDNQDVTTFNRNTSTLVMNGSGKTITSHNVNTRLHNLTIPSSTTIYIGTSSLYLMVAAVLSVSGTLDCNGKELYAYSTIGDVQVESTGKITGSGAMRVYYHSQISKQDGIIDVSTLNIDDGHLATNPIIAAKYDSADVYFRNTGISGSTDRTWTTSAGTYTFSGNVTFQGNSGSTGMYTVDNSTNNPNFVFGGNVEFTDGTSTLNWQKGTGTITFAKESGTQTANFLNKAVEDIVVGDGTTTTNTLQLVTNGVTTDQLTVNSNATFDLNGNNLSYPSSVGTYNNGTIRLKGNETLTNIANLDTDSGTVTYYGDNGGGGSPFTIYDFGTTDYYNLTFDATSGTDVFRPTDTLTIANNLTITQGTFDNATNNKNINVTGNVTMDNTQTNMGNATWTVSGDFDNKDVTTWNQDEGTLVMNGNSKEIISAGSSRQLYELTIPTGASIISSTKSSSVYVRSAEINGSLYVEGYNGRFNVMRGTLSVGANGSISGSSSCKILANATIALMAGDISVNQLIFENAGTNALPAATYNAENITFYIYSTADKTLELPSGNTYFNGKGTTKFYVYSYGGNYIINNGNNPNIYISGSFLIEESAAGVGEVIWQKGTGTITVGGTSTQSLNFANKSVEDIDITNTSNTVSITNDVTCNSLSASDNASIAVTAGKTITTSDISNIGGSASKLVTLRSSTTGSQWYLNVSGTPVVSYVDVRDSNASGGSIIYAGETSVDSGKNTNWLFTYSYSLLSDTSSINAGSSVDFTVTIKDGYNENTIPNINGVRTLIFSGANPSPSGHAPTAKDKDGNVVKFGKPTPVNFIDSVATTTLTFYCSEETSIFVTDAEPSKPNPTALTVLAPSGSLVLSAKNTTTPLDSATYLSSPDVFLNLSLSNVNTPSSARYRVSENQSNLNASLWQSYTDSAPYSLSQQDGYVTLYIVYQDEYGNNSSIYASNSVAIDVTPPSIPSNLSAYNATDTLKEQKVYASALVWSPSSDSRSGVKGYIVSRDGAELELEDGVTKTTQLTQNKEGQDVIFYIDPTLDNSTNYTYSVKAIDKAGNTSQAISSSVSIGETISGATTTLTKAENLEINFEQNQTDETITAIVSWATDAPATSQVEYGAGSYSNKTELAVTPSYNTAHTKIIEGLTPETAYNFRAISVDQNNNKASLEQSITTPESGRELSLFEIIWQKIEEYFSLIWHAIRDLFAGNFAWAKVSSPQDIQGIHVSKVLDVNSKYIGYAIYWQADKTDVALVRDGSPIAAPQTNRWLDLSAQEKDSSPVYTFANLTGEIIASLPGGTPSITDLTVKEIAVTQNSVNVEVSWLTRGVASTSQVNYSETSGNYTETVKDESLNEEHSIVVNNLSPEQTYYFTVSSTSSNGKTTTSEEVSYTLPEAAKTKSIFIIIYEALVAVFGGFIEWLYE